MDIRVLLTDPEAALLDTYRDYLVRHGFDVAIATTGADCVAKLHEWKPHVLVLEPDMPDGWGKRILDEVGHQPDLQRMPVLILSRRDQPQIAYPVREYHVKPFSMAQLANSIRAIANEHGTDR